MDFRDTPEQAKWRQEVREFLRTEWPKVRPANDEDLDAPYQRGVAGDVLKKWREKLAEKGWIAPAWPKEYGGLGLGVMEQFIMNEEFAEARVPRSAAWASP
jgi:alkylation response protein AidB-like acyl-CoA dehydrogenase